MPRLASCTGPFDPQRPSILPCYCTVTNNLGKCLDIEDQKLSWDGAKWSISAKAAAATGLNMSLAMENGTPTARMSYDDGHGCAFSDVKSNSGLCTQTPGGIKSVSLICCNGIGTGAIVQWEIVMSGMPIPSARPKRKCRCVTYAASCKICPPPNYQPPVTIPKPAVSLPVYSSKPVRYATGEIAVSASDLGAGGFGQDWGHTRSFGSQMTLSQTVGQGYNWQVSQWPYITPVDEGNSLVIQGDANNPIWFDKSGDKYVCFCDPNQLLDFDPLTNTWTHRDNFGKTTEFDGVTGQFLNQVIPGGNKIQVTALAANGYNIAQVERAATVGSSTTTERQSYAYQTTTGDALVSQCTLQRKVDSGSFANVSRADYSYFNENADNGLQGDLQTVTTKLWEDGDWVVTGTTYYRYWLQLPSESSSSSSSSSGGDDAPFAHLIKFILNPASYARMVADGHDPLTASDSLLSTYADNYFEYDSQRRVTRETVMNGSQTFYFEYFQSGYDDGVNSWQSKTIETLPDGNQNIVYSNYLGQTMLKVFQSGEDQWIDFWRYSSNERIQFHANPSAVTGYDERYPDLLNYDSEAGTFEYLRDSAGLIESYTYHEPTEYLTSESVQEGQLGDSIPVRAWEYCQCGNDCGCETSSSSSSSSSSTATDAIWLVSREIAFPDESDPNRTIVTSHCYSFYDGTCAVQQHKTTLPVIPAEQNGSGIANTNRQYFDVYGNLTWLMNERGFISRMAYDVPTGTVTQQVNDADTSLYPDVPAGWTTPSGGGLNVVSDFEHDDQGRIIQSLGPSHTIDRNGTATVVRTASWTVFDDLNHISYSGRGFATGTSPGYTYQLVNPVSITKMDASGRVNEQIQAVAPSTDGTLASIIADAGGGAAAFPQTSYTRWTTRQYTDCCLAASQRVYHTIPASGEGTSGTNYDETDYGYDAMKRPNRTVSPGGTITDVVYELRGLVIGTYVGTNDDGGTETDPTGGGIDPDNNMVIVTANEYDDGADGGDGNLTEVTQYVNATSTRVTQMAFDFRNRHVTTDGEIDYFQKQYLDNLDRVIRIERYDTTEMGNLIGLSEQKYDDQGRVYRSIRYGVDPATGTIGNSLTDNNWFDASGNAVKTLPAGSRLFTKTKYDSLGRAAIRYRGYDLDESSYSDVFVVVDDVIIEQAESIYDDANLVIQSILRRRYHNAPDTQTGPLQDPSTTPKARVTYSAAWQDGIGRVIASADFGTNGGSAFSRPDTIPIASDTVLVSLSLFEEAGNLFETTDPAGMVTRLGYDDRGRKTLQVDNYRTDSSSSSSSVGDGCEPSDDVNRTTRYTFTPDGKQATMTAENWRTGDQTTTWNYGTTLADSDISSSQLLRSLAYPDSVSSSDTVRYGYNRQGGRITLTDQRGCVRVFDYDKLGRQIHDRVTTVGDGVDDAVLRLSTTYEVRGMVETLTSWDNASVTLGDAVNQCLFNYNDFAQLIADYQEHSGEVDTDVTPVVQYEYADGGINTIRQTAMTYPNGRILRYDYGSFGGINDAISRIVSLIDDDVTTHLADYSFVGLNQCVVVDYAEPDVKYTLVDQAGANDPDTGDIYSGWDRFGRTKDCRWYDYGNSNDIVRMQYGYDRASDRLWRADLVARSLRKDMDESYSYDGLHRLKDMQRGLLNSTNTAITNETFAQCWSLDSTSNWHGFREANAGSSSTIVQSRSANNVNEITAITNTIGSGWITPAYDTAGNTTTLPQSADPTKSYTGTCDAWNRLIALADGTTSDTVQVSQYDPRHFRVIREDYMSGTLSETRHSYFNSGWKGIEDRLGTSPASANPERQFVWGLRYVDDLVLRDRDTTSNEERDERLYANMDATWSVLATISSNADVNARYLYSAYGAPEYLDSVFSTRSYNTTDLEYLFTGRHFNNQTGLTDFRQRTLSSLLGQFLSRDPVGTPDGPNLYAPWFVPNWTDPFGTDHWGGFGTDWSMVHWKKDAKLYRLRGYGPDVHPNVLNRTDKFHISLDMDYFGDAWWRPNDSVYIESLDDAYEELIGKFSIYAAAQLDKHGKPSCIDHLRLSGHGHGSNIAFEKGNVIDAVSIDAFIAFANQTRPSEEFTLSIQDPQIQDTPPRSVKSIMTLFYMVSMICDGGTLTIHMCDVDDSVNNQLRRLVELAGRSNVTIVTFPGKCCYTWGGKSIGVSK
jgi:RHS repeat-associated protein